MFLVANKKDMCTQEEVSESDGIDLAKEIGAIFQRVSAKESTGIDDLFSKIGETFLNSLGEEENINNPSVENDNDENEINNLKNKIDELEEKNKDLENEINDLKEGKDLLPIIFCSENQKILYSIICKKTDTFNLIENKLYDIYPECSQTENKFYVNNNEIIKSKTISENNIKYSDIVKIISYNK